MKKCGCMVSKVTEILVIVGALNWGLAGVGMLMDTNLNVVNMLLGKSPAIEAIVYVLVGIAGIVEIFGCKCAKCKACCAGSETPSATTGAQM